MDADTNLELQVYLNADGIEVTGFISGCAGSHASAVEINGHPVYGDAGSAEYVEQNRCLLNFTPADNQNPTAEQPA